MMHSPEIMASGFTPWEPGLFSLAVFFLLTAGLVVTLLVLSVYLNRRKPEGEKARPYECGVIPTGTARPQYPAPFWLVAVFFLLFDVEAVYIVSWAVSFTRLDWVSWAQITFFIGVLMLGLFWIWRKGGLEWGMRPRR